MVKPPALDYAIPKPKEKGSWLVLVLLLFGFAGFMGILSLVCLWLASIKL
jgi:hypothetical protein